MEDSFVPKYAQHLIWTYGGSALWDSPTTLHWHYFGEVTLSDQNPQSKGLTWDGVVNVVIHT